MYIIHGSCDLRLLVSSSWQCSKLVYILYCGYDSMLLIRYTQGNLCLERYN